MRYKCGFSPLDIKIAGRWDSDCYLVYIHADADRAMWNAAAIGSTRCSPMEAPFLEIGLRAEELELP